MIEIDSSDIERVISVVIESESQKHGYADNEKKILLETVYESLRQGDDRLTNLLKLEQLDEQDAKSLQEEQPEPNLSVEQHEKQ